MGRPDSTARPKTKGWMISPKNRTEGFRGQRAIWKHYAMDESPALKQICPWKNPRLHLISHEAIGFEELTRFFCHFQGFRVFAAQHVHLNASADAPGSAPPGLPQGSSLRERAHGGAQHLRDTCLLLLSNSINSRAFKNPRNPRNWFIHHRCQAATRFPS